MYALHKNPTHVSAIATEDLIALASKLVAYESVNPPGNEQHIADFLVDRLERSSAAFSVHRQSVHSGRSNVVARAGDSERRSILLTGHMDVVPADSEAWHRNPFELHQHESRLVGRGITDMKGALAAKLLAAEAFLDDADTPGEVILGFVVDEEVGGTGTESLMSEELSPDAAIIGEPTRCQIGIAEYRAVGYTLTVRGESGHSGRPDKAINAIDALRQMLAQMDGLATEVQSKLSDLFAAGPSLNVTEIAGGSAPNVIPGEATATLDWRLLPTDHPPAVFDTALEAAIEAAPTHSAAEVTWERTFFSAGAAVGEDAPIVTAVQQAALQVGIDAAPTGIHAVTDARALAAAGIPTVLFGPGSIHGDAHTVNESLRVDALVNVAQTYRRVLNQLL